MKRKSTPNGILRIAIPLMALLTVLLFVPASYSQPAEEDPWSLSFVGDVAHHEGFAAWDADGTGPEPFGVGHTAPLPGLGNYSFYAASADYGGIDPDPNAGLAHLVENNIGFPAFLQALADQGYTLDQVQAKTSLYDLGDDVEGSDWFLIGDWSHALYYNGILKIYVDDEALITIDFLNVDNHTTSALPNHLIVSNYGRVDSIWQNSSNAVKSIGRALFEDLEGEELRLVGDLTYSYVTISGNGRDGGFYHTSFVLEKGRPELPYRGMAADHEGVAAWQADGTGPEPYGFGHTAPGFIASPYYAASRDYDDIDPDPGAAFGHFLDEMKGFNNFKLQLAYRGYSNDQLKLKYGLCSLGDDVEGEDWGISGNEPWSNYYNGTTMMELDGTPILTSLDDTLQTQYVDSGSFWEDFGTVEKPRIAQGMLSTDEEIIAEAFLNDLEDRHIFNEIYYMSTPLGSFSGNGRNGFYCNIDDARLVAKSGIQCTFVQCDSLCSGWSGTTHWTADHAPYYIDNPIVVAEGHELLIDPGVQVLVRGAYDFDIKGSITAIGNEENMITFTHSNPLVKWTGLHFQEMPDDADTSFLSHCLFENTFTNSYLPIANNSGGAIVMGHFDKLVISHCTFSNNEAFAPGGGYYPSGGAIALWEASPVIEYSTFADNHSDYGGAIMCYLHSDPLISHCTFSNNTAAQRGGAIIVYTQSSPVIEYNHFYDNHAGVEGGAISVEYESHPVIGYNLMHHNLAGDMGGAISLYEDCYPVISNNTIAYNEVDTANPDGYGGGIGIQGCDTVDLNENIIWGNLANNAQNSAQQVCVWYSCNANLYFNDVEGGAEGIGPYANNGEYLNNIDADPEFCFVEDMIYTLTGSSPCLVAGPTGNYIGAFDFGCYTELPESIVTGNPFTLYPNPVYGETIHLAVHLEKSSEANLSIYTILGEKVAEPLCQEIPSGDHLLPVSLPGLPGGTYICRLTIGTEVYTSKFVKFR